MRKTTLLSALSVLLLVCGLALSGNATTGVSNFGIQVDVNPLANGTAGYQCKATVRNLDTDEVVAAPSLALPEGEEGTSSTALDTTGDLIKFHVSHSSGKVTYQIEVRSAAGLVLADHKATVNL